MEEVTTQAMVTMLTEAMNTVRDAIVIVDRDSRIVYINEAYTRILNVPKEKVLYKKVSVIEPGAVILDVLRDQAPRYQEPVEIKTRGKHIIVNITPLIHRGELLGAVSVFEDMTELKKAQQLSHSIFKAAGKEGMEHQAAFSHIIGQHPLFLRCLRLIELVAPTDATVLVEGESGAGKEVIVDGIMRLSGKRHHPFVNINCSAIPESLIESELFGYAGGSFTGASKGGKIGKFEQANGGTIFLDEIGELPLFMQAKLLRTLQSGEIQKIGSPMTQSVDVRIIAATNRHLKKMVQEGTFREDLYFRLNTFTIHIPPLRERGEDVLLLASYFIDTFAKKYQKSLALSPEVVDIFLTYSWPGNVRELASCIEYAVIVCDEKIIQPYHLPENLQSVESHTGVPVSYKQIASHSLKEDVANLERKQMIEVLQQTKGNKTKAMAILGISRRTFYKKWKQYQLDKETYTK